MDVWGVSITLNREIEMKAVIIRNKLCGKVAVKVVEPTVNGAGAVGITVAVGVVEASLTLRDKTIKLLATVRTPIEEHRRRIDGVVLWD